MIDQAPERYRLEAPNVSHCTACHRPLTDAYLCGGCFDDLARHLRQIPWLTEQLNITLTRQARVTQRNGPRATERPLPFHLGASVDLESLRDGLAAWCHTIAEHRGVTVDAAREPVALALWLLRWPAAVVAHPDSAELAGDIIALVEAGVRTIDLNAKRRYCGPCEDCLGDMYVPEFDHGRLPEIVTCKTVDCGAQYPIAERRVWLLEQAYDRLLTASQMSRCLGELFPGRPVTPEMLWQWASRGIRMPGMDGRVKLTKQLHHHADTRKRPRYHVEEVLRFVRVLMAAEQEKATAQSVAEITVMADWTKAS